MRIADSRRRRDTQRGHLLRRTKPIRAAGRGVGVLDWRVEAVGALGVSNEPNLRKAKHRRGGTERTRMSVNIAVTKG